MDENLSPLEKIKELTPPFSGGYGWLSLAELNLIDPTCERFEVVDEVVFIDRTSFVNVVPLMKSNWASLEKLVS